MRRWTVVLALLFLAAVIPSRAAEDVAAMMTGAIKLYEQGSYKKALKQFANVLKLDPGNADAKEYMIRCSDKMVEEELGVRVEKAPSDLAPLPGAPGTAVKPGQEPQRTLRGSRRTSLPSPRRTAGPKGGKPIPLGADRPTAKDLVKQREALTEDYRKRVLGKEGPVWVESSRNQMEVVLYMNRIFLPMTDQLAPDAYPILEAAVAELRANPDKSVVLRTVDNMSPAVRHTMLDLPARRTVAMFTYFFQSALNPAPGGETGLLTAADLAD